MKFLFITGLMGLSYLVVAQPCNIPPYSLDCDSAPILCNIYDLDGYCTTMPDIINPTGPNPLCSSNGGGVSNNTIWLGFVAWDSILSISITPSNCANVGGQMGIQGGIYNGASGCANITELVCQGNCTINPITLTSGGFTVGEIYYLLIDGCAGSFCDIKLDILSGGGGPDTIGIIGPISGPAKVCTTGKYKYSVPQASGVNFWFWTVDGKLQADPGSATEEIELSFDNPGSHILCIDAATYCKDIGTEPAQYCTEIQVFEGTLPLTEQDYLICEGDSVLYQGNYFKDGESFVDTIEVMVGCNSIVKNNVKSYKSPLVDLGDVLICANECFTIQGAGAPPFIFCDTISNALVIIPNYLGCDSLIIFNIKKGPSTKDTSFIVVTLCDQDSLKYGNLDIDSIGIYYYQVSEIDSCQLVRLEVIPDSIPSNVLLTKCSNKPLIYNGKSYTSPGIYQGSFNTCKPNFNLIINEVICTGDFIYNNQTGNDTKGLNGKYLFPEHSQQLMHQSDSEIDLALVPNPSNGRFRIVSSSSITIAEWQIFNSLGKLVLNSNPYDQGSADIDGTSLNNGLYYWKGMVNGQQVLRQFIKIE